MIKKYRNDNDISMREFEKKSGLSRSYISLLEKDYDISPTIPTIRKVAKGMSISFDDLMSALDSEQEINIQDIENNLDRTLSLLQLLTRKELTIIYETITAILKPDRKTMITWLNDNLTYAASSGADYEYMNDEELRGFYESAKEKYEKYK